MLRWFSFDLHRMEKPFTRHVNFKQHSSQCYKVSSDRRRKNPDNIRSKPLDPRNDLKHLLQRRDDGRSIHTPPHLAAWHERHQHNHRHTTRFNPIKGRHEDDGHHQTIVLREQQQEQLQRRKHQVYIHPKSKPIKIQRPLRKKTKGIRAQDSTLVQLSLHHHHERTTQPATAAPKLPSNSLLFGWGQSSTKPHHSRKKLAGPSLVQALALSPRPYPESLPRRLTARRRPQQEYYFERKEKIKERAERAGFVVAHSKESRFLRPLPPPPRVPRPPPRATMNNRLLRQLKQSVLLLSPRDCAATRRQRRR